MGYTLDANILINMERLYPREFFSSLWRSMETAVQGGDICMCEMVQKELRRGDDDLLAWVKSIPGFVCKTTDEELQIVAKISAEHPAWVQGQKNYADPFVIAHAKDDGLIVVTEERRAGPNAEDKNLKIPNVSDEYGVTCMKFFDLLRTQGWKF